MYFITIFLYLDTITFLILSKYFLLKYFIKFHKAQFINKNNARSFIIKYL